MSQRVIAVCADAVPPADGDPLAECTSVIWVRDTTQLTQAEVTQLFGAVAVFFALIFVWKKLRSVL